MIFIQSGDTIPVTNAINDLDDYSLIAAGTMITVIPTLLVHVARQRQFGAGLTLGGGGGDDDG